MPDPRLRPLLAGIAPYTPGRVARSATGHSYLLASNESPHDPLPGIVEAVCAAATGANRYPDSDATDLLHTVADALGVSAERIALGAGSVALLQMLFQAVGEPGVEVVHAWRSFELYPLLAQLAGVETVPVPLADGAHDLPAMAAAITPRTRMILICNPNNPTGTVLSHEQLAGFIAAVPTDCLVVVDEAYHEYVQDSCAADGLTLCADRPNVVVLRTFSKAYGLAGLRVGYLIGSPDVVVQLRKTYLPFSLSTVAQTAAVASLRLRDELLARVAITVVERDRVAAGLSAAGWVVPSSEANFLWLRTTDLTPAFVTSCAEVGVSVRAFDGEGVRVSVGSRTANDAFLEVATTWPGRLNPPR